MKHLTPHIIEEGLLDIQQEFHENSDSRGTWRRETYKLRLRSCFPLEPKSSNPSSSQLRLYQFTFLPDQSNKSYPPMNVGELFAIYSPSWQASNSSCLAYIHSGDANSTYLSDQIEIKQDESNLIKLCICISGSNSNGENNGWLLDKNLVSRSKSLF